MAGSMQKIAKRCFRAMQVVDRFHVSKLVYEAVQDLLDRLSLASNEG